MTLTQEQRKELIPQLDHYQERAQHLQREIDALVYPLQDTGTLLAVRIRARDLADALQTASDDLKRANEELICTYITNWHHFRLDDNEDEEASEERDPMYESIHYDGGDVWSVVISTATHGRERVVVHSDAASWYTVYSTNPA